MHKTIFLLTVVLLSSACAPKAPILSGGMVPVHIPATDLPSVHQKLIFRWSYVDNDFRVQGEGVARMAPPDSVRLDLFIGNGLGTGPAFLMGDSLRTEVNRVVRNYLPPVPLLWAIVGRLRVPATKDTVARVDGDTLRVEIGHNPAWRATFVGSDLRHLDLIDDGRIPQWVSRDPDGHIRYVHTTAHRKLELTIVRTDTVSAFDAAIWH